MLILGRQYNDEVVITTPATATTVSQQITIKVLKINSPKGWVHLGFSAPKNVRIDRGETL